MPDREMVIEALECIAGQKRSCEGCPYSIAVTPDLGGFSYGYCAKGNVLKDAIALLKEHEIVRCKDCIYYNSEPDSHGDYCDKIHWSRGLNWFCADGVRKVSEDEKRR